MLETRVTTQLRNIFASRGIWMNVAKKKVSGRPKAIDPVIPNKLYFRIGEVADICDLPTYVLRFWETEFPQLKPGKSSTGQRMYRRRDVENVLRIRFLGRGYQVRT